MKQFDISIELYSTTRVEAPDLRTALAETKARSVESILEELKKSGTLRVGQEIIDVSYDHEEGVVDGDKLEESVSLRD